MSHFVLGLVRPRALVASTIALLACTLPVGCSSSGPEPGSADPVGEVSSPIINGTASTPAQNAVVLLVTATGQGMGTCSGTMVAPNLVLTARHCVSDTDEGAVCTADGTAVQGGEIGPNHTASSIYVFTGTDAAARMQNRQNPDAAGKKIIVDDAATVLCNKDLAFLVLDRAISSAKAPVAAIRRKVGARLGEDLTAVGWGLTEDGSGQIPSHRMQRTGVAVQLVGPYEDSKSKAGVGDAEFIVGESICSGDSGGPAFDSKGAVVGVVSRGGNGTGNPNQPGSSCTGDALNFYTQLPTMGDLIGRAFTAAGATPTEQDTLPGKANATYCSIDAQCSGGVCLKNKCATACKADTDCASGESCQTVQSKKGCVASGNTTPAPDPSDDGDDGSTAEPDAEDAGDSTTGAPATGAAPGATTTTTTTTGCSTSPGSSGGFGFGGLVLGLGALFTARRRRS